METVVEVVEILQVVKYIKDLFDKNGDGDFDGDLLPQEVTDVLKTLGDGEQGNNDVENILIEIKNSLMYNEEYTALSEISSRLELIDTRIDREFEVINTSFSFVITSIVALFSWKFFGWLMRLFSI